MSEAFSISSSLEKDLSALQLVTIETRQSFSRRSGTIFQQGG